MTSFEALMRWRHPDMGAVPPSEFIEIAEETGLIIGLSEWALNTACREAAAWPSAANVAVNLSPVQFRDPGLVAAVRRALTLSGLPAGRLELEITETALLRDNDVVMAALSELRALGVRIVMDDFGTGFSSLGYLLRFPFDKIKIDRSFIAGLPAMPEAQAIVRGIIGIGRSLGITIVAEGVETQEQWEALCSTGCDVAQGFLFSRPMAASSVAAFLHDKSRLGEEQLANG